MNLLRFVLLCGLIASYASSTSSTGSPAVAQNFFKDEALTLKVVSKLQFNKALLREKIDVKTSNGIVTLSGNVSSPEQIRLAGKLAQETDGVVKVNNFLKVGPPIRDTPSGTAP